MKFLEAIFRHYLLLMFILFVPIIISLVIGYIYPPSYQASATLWAIKQYANVNTGGAASSGPTTPADTQIAALKELLQSRAFDIAVGKSTDLKSTLNVSDPGNTDAVNDAYVADLSKNVVVASKGSDLFQITYTNNDARIAAQVVGAVITQFKTDGLQFSIVDGQTFSIVQGQHLLEGDKAQLKQTQADADTAAKNEAAYLQAHPGAGTSDPQYAVLNAERVQAETSVTNLQATIATLSQQIAASQHADFFKTLDPPVAPNTSLRSKVLVTAGGIGAGVGVVLCIVCILVLIRRDRSFYSAMDLQKATSYPILLQVPLLPNAAKENFIPGVAQRGR